MSSSSSFRLSFLYAVTANDRRLKEKRLHTSEAGRRGFSKFGSSARQQKQQPHFHLSKTLGMFLLFLLLRVEEARRCWFLPVRVRSRDWALVSSPARTLYIHTLTTRAVAAQQAGSGPLALSSKSTTVRADPSTR